MSLTTRISPLTRLSRHLHRPLTTIAATRNPAVETPPVEATASSTRQHHVVVSLSGQDRVGIVNSFTSAVEKHNANIEESKMAILGGDFAMIVYVSLESVSDADNLASLVRDELPGFSISMRPTNPPVEEQRDTRSLWKLQFEGPDQPGIVAAVSQALATHGANVHDLETETTTAPFAGYSLFKLNGKIAVAEDKLETVADALSKLEDRFGSSVILDQIAEKP